MKLQVLISCMHQTDHSIIERTNIQSDVIVINQCDNDKREEFDFINKSGDLCHAIFIHSTERGLSKSRNLALRTATAEICLICDDDEILDFDYCDKIKKAYETRPELSLIAFQIKDSEKYFPKNEQNIGYLRALKLASWQLTFKRLSIIKKNIYFDETLGSGVSKAGGEENKFLYDCLDSKLKISYIPICIGRMIENDSQWFHGFTKEFFYDRGIMTRKLMGSLFAYLYGVYYIIRKYPQYRKDIDIYNASKSLLKGLFYRE